MTASDVVAAVVVATVVVAGPAVATMLLLSAAVSVVVKMSVLQTPPNASSRVARRQWSSARLAKQFVIMGLFAARLAAITTASFEARRRRQS